MYAPHNKLDNLIAIVDVNGQQIDGPTDKICSLLDLSAKYEAFGWNVIKCNGNNMEELDIAIQKAQTSLGTGKPSAIMMTTEMGMGVDYMMGSHKWHGVSPNDAQLATALLQLEETLGDF